MARLLWPPGAGSKVAGGASVLLVGAVVLALSVLAAGEIARFAGAFGNAAPFVLLAVLGQLQPLWPALRPLTWLVFCVLLLVLVALVLGATLMGLDPATTGDLSGGAAIRLLIALGLGLAALVGSLCLLIGGAWVAVAHRLGGVVDPRDVRHVQGFIGLIAATLLAFVPLIVLGGEAPALRMVETNPEIFGQDRSASGQLLDLVYSLVWTIPLALVLVGVPTQRTVREAIGRLGIHGIDWRGLLAGIAGAAVLWVVGTALDAATYWLWGAAGWPRTDAKLVERLMSMAFSPIGAVVTAITAGLGEELMMRGVFQPRFGWLLPNLAFTAAHALQYNLDALIGVFVAGAILAFVRGRWNTTVAIVAHTLYDLVLFLSGPSGG